jgi:hypothetical protein
MKRKSARRDTNLTEFVRNRGHELPPHSLLTIQQLSKARNIPARSIRTMLSKGVLSCFRFGHRMMFFRLEQFDKDIRAYEVKSRFANEERMSAKETLPLAAACQDKPPRDS